MLMNFSSKKRAVHATPVMFPGRTGHRAARINDSIFVVGGTDKCGKLVSEVHRINCLSNRIDCIILENSLTLEGFSLFCHQESLFIWGGLHLRQHMNQLLHFDGNKFIALKQTGPVPKPRAYHTSTTFANKYLILFAGSDGTSFFNDWHLLNLKTLNWQPLLPSLEIKYNLGCSMVWANGRGILLVNQLFDEYSNSIISNSFYQFYVSDYNTGRLNILPLDITNGNPIFQEYIFNHMTVSDQNSILIFGGYKLNANTELHSLSYILSLDQLKLEKTKFKYKEKSEFQSIYHRNKLYLIGGILSKHEMEECVQIHESSTEKMNFKRHVCVSCKLYYDEEWFMTSREAYQAIKIRQEIDYNYHMRIDNRILAKFSAFITSDLYALTLILQSLSILTANHIEVSFQKYKEDYSMAIEGMVDETYHYLKVTSSLENVDPCIVVNQLLMVRQRDCQDCLLDADVLELAVLRLKVASYRLGRSCLISLRTSKDQVCVIYFSCNQIECPYSNYNPFNNSHYYYNLQTKVYSSKNNRHIVYENVKHVLKNADYEEVGENVISMVIFCGDEIEGQLVSFQQNWEAETGETCSLNPVGKDENRKMLPLLQFSFLPTPKHSNIFIDQTRINFINILDLLIGDMNSKILQRISTFNKPAEDIVQRTELFYYPSEYWLRRLLIYHSNRLIMHFQESSLNICGVIILRPTVELDLSGNRPAKLAQQLRMREMLKEIRGLKRGLGF